MKGLMAPALVLTLTSMVMGQSTTFPTEPIAYSLPVSDSIIKSLKVEGWRQADIEVGVAEWIWQVVLRNPELGEQPAPVELANHAGIRAGKIHFLVNDESLELIHKQGLIYPLKPEERGQFTKIILVYESEFATVPMSSELATLHLPPPPVPLNLAPPPTSQQGRPPVDLPSTITNATALENIARTNRPSSNRPPGPNNLENTAEMANQTTTFIEQWSANGQPSLNTNSFRAQVRDETQSVAIQSQSPASAPHESPINQAEAATLAQKRAELNQERFALRNKQADENRTAITYPNDQDPNRYANNESGYPLDSRADRYHDTNEAFNPNLSPSLRENGLAPMPVESVSATTNEVAALVEENNTPEETGSHSILLWLMLSAAIGLNVYLGLIARGLYVRYDDLSHELTETFTSSI
ncbi:MAG: hypothetical protein MK106_10830 [Mariniblastus sp.]|nr:hypothetical protein [Mariniblastus sp.]